MESQQKKKTGKGSPSGKVWLAGAGPGDASLLTLKVKKWMAAIAFVMFISGTFIQEAFAETWKQGMNGDLSVC